MDKILGKLSVERRQRQRDIAIVVQPEKPEEGLLLLLEKRVQNRVFLGLGVIIDRVVYAC